jgi:hypothetical protein
MNLKAILITLSCIAGLLIVITFYVVFYGGGGTYVVSSDLGPNVGIFVTSTATLTSETASSTTSSTLALASSSASSTITSITAPAVTWTQEHETLSVINASISGLQLTLGVQVTMDSVAECVPLTLRMIADEQGDLSPPITSQFTFPDTGTCNGTPGETYSAQPIVFTLNDPATFPIILTTGGTANVLFEVTQNSDGSLSVQLPPSTD